MRWVNLKIKPMKALFDGGVDESVESAIAIKLGNFFCASTDSQKNGECAGLT
jgi:hypothetical protein